MEQVIEAPSVLTLDERASFRRDAVARLARMDEGDCLVIDLAATQSVDSAGLGTLIVVRRHAEGRRLGVRLTRPSSEMRVLLRLTKLDQLFDVEE